MPEITFNPVDRLRSVVATSIKAGNAAGDPVGILAVRAATVSRKATDGTMIEVIATTDDIDLDDEVVVPDGANVEYFRRNGSVFIDHDCRFGSRAGVARAIRPWPASSVQRGWVVDVALDRDAQGDEVLSKILSGGMGMSIGFRSRDRGTPTPEEVKRYSRGTMIPRSIVRKWDWLELSFTPMPCNVACRVVAVPTEAVPKSYRQIVVKGGMGFVRKVVTA